MDRIKQADLAVSRNVEGAWVIATVADGRRQCKVYHFYTKREAIRLFLAQVNGRELD